MNIKYHPDVHGYAVNVKTHRMHFPDGGTEGQRELAWDATHEDWWNDANEIARQEGFDGAAACGRSCGWCAPYDVNKGVAENSSRHYCYVQTAYESEINDDASDPDGMRDEAVRFQRFAERIETLLLDAPARYKANLERTIEEDKDEAAEAKRTAAERQEMRDRTLKVLEVAAQGITEYIKWEEARDVLTYWRKQWGI